MTTDKESLRKEHGQIASVTLSGTTFHFRKPTIGEYQRCMDRMNKDKGAGVAALRELVNACCLPHGACEDALKNLPAAIPQIGNALLELAGSEIEVTISKD